MIAFGGEGVEDALVEIINAAYETGEAGIWGPRRTGPGSGER